MSEQECRNYVNCGEFVEDGVLCENCESEASVLDRFVIAAEEMGDKKWIPVSDPIEVGKALREMRLSLCQTQGFMADLFDIPVSKWRALEHGRKPL